MCDEIPSSVLPNDNSRLQFINESPILLNVSEEKSKTLNSNYEVSSEDDGWCDTEMTKKKLKPGKKTRGRVKIKMEFIKDKVRRFTTFSKRKTGIMKKAYELAQLTGAQLMLLVASETGHVYTFATDKLKPIIDRTEGQDLIEACLNNEIEVKQALKRPHNATSEPTPLLKSTTFKKSLLAKASSPLQKSASSSASQVLNMVMNEVKPAQLKKIVIPIDLSYHYDIQQPANNTSNDNNNYSNKNINNTCNKSILKLNNTKNKNKSIQFNKTQNNFKIKNNHILNNNNNQFKNFKLNNDSHNNNNNNIDIITSLQSNLNKNNIPKISPSHSSIYENNIIINNANNNIGNFINNNNLTNNNLNIINNILISTNLNTSNAERVLLECSEGDNILINADSFNNINNNHSNPH